MGSDVDDLILRIALDLGVKVTAVGAGGHGVNSNHADKMFEKKRLWLKKES